MPIDKAKVGIDTNEIIVDAIDQTTRLAAAIFDEVVAVIKKGAVVDTVVAMVISNSILVRKLIGLLVSKD